MIVQFRNEKVSNHGSIPVTIDCNVVAFIVLEEGFHQPIKHTKQRRELVYSVSSVSQSKGANEDKEKWVRDQKSTALARASQIEG
ncbi:hypothetical protein TNCV_3953781 [Trichonephila clavipes]|nr:hypothetical protein TNCV_3953781 [Trichonephila clavipes]